MDRLFIIGMAIGFFVSGVAAILITVSQQLGIGLVLLSLVLAFLFVYPKSPVRKKWWSVSGKLQIATSEEPGYKAHANSEYISVWVLVTSWSGIIVERIVIEIRGERIPSFDWKSHQLIGRENKFLDFKRPDWFGLGKYKLNLIAYTPDGYSKSREFILEVTI